MTYYGLFEEAEHLLIKNKITYDEYVKMVEPLNEEVRKVGAWIENETTYADNVRQTCECSVCGKISPRPLGDYCRWCGAKMGGASDE